MFRSILVPLDGSPAAAHAIPYVPLVAAPNARVILVGVATPLLEAPFTPAQERGVAEQLERARALLWQDLEVRAQPLRAQGFHVATTVRTGDVTDQILACSREVDADLIVLATQSTGSLSCWMLGSIARRLLYTATLPTLFVRSTAELAHMHRQIDGVIVPLDGSQFAEASLPFADEQAARLGVPQRIVRVVPNQASLLQQTHAPSDIVAVHRINIALKQAHTAAQHYVESSVDRVQRNGRDTTGEVRVGDPAATLSALLAEQPNALVVIATHGESDGDRWSFGSIAEKVLITTSNPALIVHPPAGKMGLLHCDPALAARYPD